mmetsp:Transcript_6495/g.18195  ORF Transcript_6495/g.18195 Transcript_6495/m.18195 type:complete len:301 (+) Transcript_6495:92-994(+)
MAPPMRRRRQAGALVAVGVLLVPEAVLRCTDVLLWVGGHFAAAPLPRTGRASLLVRAAEEAAKVGAGASLMGAGKIAGARAAVGVSETAEVSAEGSADTGVSEGDAAAAMEKRRSSVLRDVGVGKMDDLPVGGAIGGGFTWINRPGKRSFEVRWLPGDTIGDLKALIRKESELDYDNQELRSNGEGIGDDDRLLDEWVGSVESGGITAQFTGKAPDIWVFDGSSIDEREAAFPPIAREGDEEVTWIDIGFTAFTRFVAVFATFFVSAQIAGLNPLTKQFEVPIDNFVKAPLVEFVIPAEL